MVVPGRPRFYTRIYATCLASKRFLLLLHLRTSFSTLNARRAPRGSLDSEGPDLRRTRNIGIIAHIDAGKTTTTERMLYYSGVTRRIGNVDEGSTVTDFLPAERARGITIQSAAITFNWPPSPLDIAPASSIQSAHGYQSPFSPLSHTINLIDTPGHADFTFEVRRSLRVLDGAICILDGVAGVEAQTEQVWKQAGAWQIPRIVFVNKLDRDGAAFGRTVKEVGSRLGSWPAVCQIPWWEGGKGRFTGVADVINMQGLLYPEGGDGKKVTVCSLESLEKTDDVLAQELKRARTALVELLSEHDEDMVDDFLDAEEDHLAVSPSRLLASLRKCLLTPESKIIPLFAGASFRNIGVQPLLDAVVNLLPGPNERPDPEVSLGNVKGGLQAFVTGTLAGEAVPTRKSKLKSRGLASPPSVRPQDLEGCALAFKVVNDPRKGVLVYFRVYSGSIRQSSMVYNTNLKVSERVTSLLRMYASASVGVDSVEAGQIGVIAGSKHARTGDTLIAYAGSKAAPPEPFSLLQLQPIEVPPPVFFASIEPRSLRDEKEMKEKLNLLLREDPSLHVSQDEDTGQTQLSGMGELHLEIARDRLVNDLKANATMGDIEIGYRQTISQRSSSITKVYDRDVQGSKGRAGCTAMAEPLNRDALPLAHALPSDGSNMVEQDGNVIVMLTPTLDEDGLPKTSAAQRLPDHLPLSEVRAAFINGALTALSRGPDLPYPMRHTRVTLKLDPDTHVFGTESTLSALASAARVATVAAIKDAVTGGGSTLMEPVMNVSISLDEVNLGTVVNDISSSRGGHIVSLDDEIDKLTISDQEDVAQEIDTRKIYAPPDPFTSTRGSRWDVPDDAGKRPRTIRAKVPLKEMVGYLKHLRSITGGRGTFVMSVDQFERMSGQRKRALLANVGGNF